MTPIIAISMGDPNGIGPEVVMKTLARADLNESIPVWIGSKTVFNYYSDQLKIEFPKKLFSNVSPLETGYVYILDLFESLPLSLSPGTISPYSGKLSMEAVEKGIELCLNSHANALVTAPISKEAINKAGYNVPGHTEFLAQKTGTSEVLMVLTSPDLRVALATIHIPVKKIAESIEIEKLEQKLRILQQSLVHDFGIDKPGIGVLGLNPHAGDGGVIGTEEIDFIQPVIRNLSKSGLRIEGPFAADGYFGRKIYKKYDATFAMYHDQGLIPFKTLTFGKGVNFTAGLPIIRTSPDHGTAFNIAGKNLADEKSFLAAYHLAVRMAKNKTQLNR